MEEKQIPKGEIADKKFEELAQTELHDVSQRDPLLEKSYSFQFCILAMLLLASTIWAVWDETYTRRPWKKYQREYKRLQLNTLNTELRQARDEYQQTVKSAAYQEIKQKLATVKIQMRQPEARKKLETLQQKLAKLTHEEEKLLAEFRELNGKFHALEYRHSKTRDPMYAAVLNKWRPQLDQLSKDWKASRQAVRAQRKEIEKFTVEYDNLERKLNAFYKPVLELEQKIDQIKKDPIAVKEFYIEELDIADRCTSCHTSNSCEIEEYPLPFRRHPSNYLINHPPERFGCTICHRGQGFATLKKDAHGHVKYWLTPMLQGEFLQSDCQKCHDDLDNLKGAPTLTAGFRLYKEKGCLGCHSKEGYHYEEKIGSPLAYTRDKIDPAWAYAWLKDPDQDFLEHRMPNFGLSTEEINAILTYIYALPSPLAQKPKIKITENKELLKQGELVYTRGQCMICHESFLREETVTPSPRLENLQNKLKDQNWLYYWLKRPYEIYPQTTMPRYRFTENELQALNFYLLRSPKFRKTAMPTAPDLSSQAGVMAVGRALVRQYGCVGCHDIFGHSKDGKIGPDHTLFGNKPREEIGIPVYQSRQEWALQKLSAPRSLGTNLKMPLFRLTKEEQQALSVLLIGFTPKVKLPDYRVNSKWERFFPTGPAGLAIERYRCLTCHQIRGEGGKYGPDLTYLGDKVQLHILNRFLESPFIVQPLLQPMPNLNIRAEEASVLADYIHLTLVRKVHVPVVTTTQDSEENLISKGKQIYAQKGCSTCHRLEKQGGILGPDLSNSGKRLTHDYLLHHLKNPFQLNPDTREPNPGLRAQEIPAVAAFLMSFQKFRHPTHPVNTRWANIKDRCEGCHKYQIKHKEIQDECNTCHTQEGWKDPDLLFEHAKLARFTRTGKHAQIECSECHKNNQWRGISSTCNSCHEPLHEDFNKDCRECHVEQGWKQPYLKFKHQNLEKFSRDGKHAQVDCIKCHKTPRQWRGLSTRCADCHEDPHSKQFGEDECTRCHTTQGWTGENLLFKHTEDPKFILLEKHLTMDCRKCHKVPDHVPLANARLAGLSQQCINCHEVPHKGTDSDCRKCHIQKGWKGELLQFDHNRDAQFKLTGLHQNVECVQCHQKGESLVYGLQNKDCKGCHQELTNFIQGKIAGLKGEADYHSKLECTECHQEDRLIKSPEEYRSICMKSCHKNLTTIDMLFNDWPKGFADRRQKVERWLQKQNTPISPRTQDLMNKLEKYQRHNIRFSHKILNYIPRYNAFFLSKDK